MLRSPPSRRRGLKLISVRIDAEGSLSPPSRRRGLKCHVAPNYAICTLVASFAEAWIEIRIFKKEIFAFSVASFAEAWIEILLSSSRLCRCIPSPPSRRRGLKFFLPPLLRWYSLSPPSRRRGLKYSVTPEKLLTVVASFAEAWIEIPLKCLYIQPTIVASFAEAWIEISGVDSPFKGMKCRLLRGGVD